MDPQLAIPQPTYVHQHSKMFSMRFFRRRGLSVLCKSVLVISLVVLFVQLSSSFPRGVNYARNESPEKAQPAQVVQPVAVVNHGLEESVKKVEPEVDQEPAVVQQAVQKPQITQKREFTKAISKQSDQVTSKNSGSAISAQHGHNREGEFYENVIVHFDLKGAPPKLPYFLEMLRLVAKSGATGILLEWEDMFPWTGRLEMVRNTDAYSMEQVKTILEEAKKLNLDIIPLVQTFGHLEWFLKFEEFRQYRENDAYPQVLCLGDDDGVSIVKDALKQVIDAHREYGIPFFHIGADEAFEFGVCAKSLEWIGKHGKDGGKQTLALSHLKKMAEYVKELVPETTVLAWHDMLKDFEGRLIKKLELGSLVEPVIWDYSETIVTMNDYSFSAIAENFPVVWASAAYKGANFPSAKYIDVRHYETNNLAWIKTKQQQEKKYKKFHGIIVTGWQRYDHMAALCEILPMGTPSMILQIQIALAGANVDQRAVRDKAASLLGCQGFQVAGLNVVSRSCQFPGAGVYEQFQGMAQQTIASVEDELSKNHHIMGWMSPYSARHNISQNWYIGQIEGFVSNLHGRMKAMEDTIRREMNPLFFENTIDEFLYLTLAPTTDKLAKLLEECARLKKLRSYPKRHFEIERGRMEL